MIYSAESIHSFTRAFVRSFIHSLRWSEDGLADSETPASQTPVL